MWCGSMEQLLVCLSLLSGSGVPREFPGGGGGAAQTGAEDLKAEPRRALCRIEGVQEGQDGVWNEWV